jgi:hypothetical protein
MSRNKKDIFKEVISKAETQKPANDMANLVMQQITAETQDEVDINRVLKELLQQHATDAAPMVFTRNVMAQVNPPSAQADYAPLISKKAWYIAASVLGAVMLLNVFAGSGNHAIATSIGGNTIKQINAMPAVYIITLTLGGLLLVVEHFITSLLRLAKQ